MAGLSKITLVGNLLSEPQASQTSTGIQVTRLEVGVEREARGQGTSETVVDPYLVTVFGQNGSELEQRFRSGQFGLGARLLVMGKLEHREWSDQRGPQHSLDVTADDVFDLGPDSAGAVQSLLGGNAPCRVIVVGNMGGDPEVRQVPSGKTVVNFNLAVSRPISRQAQQRDENTNWYRIAGWANIADRMQKLADMGALAKGRKILVEGMFTPREWVDNNGQRRISLDVMARDFELLQGSGDAGQGDDRYSGNSRSSDQFQGGGQRGRSEGGYGGSGRGGAAQDDPFGAPGDNRGGRGGRQDENFGNQDVDDIPF